MAGEPPASSAGAASRARRATGTVELGYAVAPPREGRGLATAAVRAMLRDAFADPGVHAVIAHTLPEAGPSPRVLEKAGFTRTGEVTGDHGEPVWRFRILDGALPA